jgi:hypothetical protein
MDEYLRRMFPLHNEYYMAEELKTVLGLNEFKFIKGSLVKFPENVHDHTAFFSGLYGDLEKDCLEFLEGNREAVSGDSMIIRMVASLMALLQRRFHADQGRLRL